MIILINRIVSLVLTFSLIAFTFSGCKIQKPATTPAKPKLSYALVDASSFYKAVTDNYPVYNTFLIKLSAEYTGKDQSQSLNGVIRIKKDSIICISVSAILGYEIVRFIFTPDSVKFINKIDNTYYLGNYDYIKRLFNISFDFHALQALMTDEFFIYGKPSGDYDFTRGFTQSTGHNTKCLSYSNPPVDQKICINPSSCKIEKLEITDNILGRTMLIAYSEFMQEENVNLPRKIVIDLTSDYESSNIAVKYSKVILNKRLDFPFKILDEYKRIY